MKRLLWLLALIPVLIPVSSVNSQLPSSPPPVLAACYNAATATWVTLSSNAIGTPLLSQPPSLVGIYGKNSNGSFYPIACDTSGNITTQSLVPPVAANWSTLGAGCTNSTTTSIGGGAAIQITGQSATTNTCGVKVTASGNFSHIVVISSAPNLVSFSSILIGFTDGTKYEACGVGFNGTLQATAISSATLTGTVAAANGSVTNASVIAGSPQYFRLVSSGTTLSCDYSPDQGNNWVNVFTDTTPFLTVSNVFFGANQRGGAGTPYGLLLSYQ